MAVVRTLIGNVKGVKGDTGAQGAHGNAGEITIGSVTTGSYGTPAAVVNSGTPTNAVLDFTIPQGAPGATVTDASPLTASTITTATADYPTYTAGETIAVILGKIAKFFSDIRANGLFKSNLINGFTQTTPGVNALDAAAGKTLNDSFANFQTEVATELANRTIDQTAGQTLTIDTSMTGVRVSSTETDFVVLLPFIAKNRNYSVNLTFFSITNIGSGALSKTTVTDKRLTTFRIQYAGDASVPLANGIFTITFA